LNIRQPQYEERRKPVMTMGLKVRALLTDKEIKERAKARKAESDAILENIYALLTDKKKKVDRSKK
jgi:hypothetical protein